MSGRKHAGKSRGKAPPSDVTVLLCAVKNVARKETRPLHGSLKLTMALHRVP
jgi:hypothetical protein